MLKAQITIFLICDCRTSNGALIDGRLLTLAGKAVYVEVVVLDSQHLSLA